MGCYIKSYIVLGNYKLSGIEWFVGYLVFFCYIVVVFIY